MKNITLIKHKGYLLGLFFILSCSKDIGNYKYNEINEIAIAEMSTEDNPLTVLFGTQLHIAPELKFSIPGTEQSGVFSYKWILLGTNGEQLQVLSTEKELNYQVELTPKVYRMAYYVKDESTGVSWQQNVWVKVNTNIYEGYLVMNEVSGGARLDMLSYNDGAFTQMTDILSTVHSSLTLQGAPLGVWCSPKDRVNTQYNVNLLTTGSTDVVDGETFGYDPLFNIRYKMRGNIPPGFVVDNMRISNNYGIPSVWLRSGQRMVSTGTAGIFNYDLPANVYQNDILNVFPVAEKWVADGSVGVMYNQQKKCFVTNSAGIAYSKDMDKLVYPGYPEGLDLVDMFSNQYVTGSSSYAILKDPGTGKKQIFTFIPGKAAVSLKDVNPAATNFDLAEHFAISPLLNYLFYNVGGKVYQYDLTTTVTRLMLDLGNEQISYLNFVPFFYNMYPGTNPLYKEWGTWLSIGSYDPAGTAGANGTLAQYSVSPVNGPLVEKNRWTGMGKIVSVAYRDR